MAPPKNTRKPRISIPQRKTPPPEPKQQPMKAIKNMDEILETLRQMTAKYEGRYKCVTSLDELGEYLEAAKKAKRLAIDTETTGLNIFTDKVVGFSIYTGDRPACYVPLRHLSRFTGKLDESQPDIIKVADMLRSIPNDVTLDLANAQFDIMMLKHSVGVDFTNYRCRDALIMARILDTERKAGKRNLKDLHADYCAHTTRGPRFGELFPPGTFHLCPYKLGYTYGARDAEMTWELMDYLLSWFEREPELQWIYENIEMPLLPVLIRMRERGIKVDQAKRAELTFKYKTMMEDAVHKIEALYAPFIPRIKQYQMSAAARKPKHGIDLPVKIGSNDQIAVLLYDIMKLGNGEDRSVDKGGLGRLNAPIGEAILEYRMCKKLLSTYLEGLEKFIQPDGCVRGGIRQIGADTGRTSSYDPNMQNIPSRNREIRQIYQARPNYALVSCDYSAQEPRLTASLCRDETMIKAYQEGKDLYSIIASVAFNKSYEDCQEHYPNGELNKDGKWRRGQAKTIVLGICYGRQIKSIAEQLGCSKEEAQVIYDKVTTAFPGLLRAQDEASEQAHEFGYVTTLWGRRRHLTPMKHDDYEFEYAPGCNPDFDPFNPDASALSCEVPKALAQMHLSKLQGMRYWKDKVSYIDYLKNEFGIITTDYSRIRGDMSRKCLNARIQGSAADMSKLAMIAIDKDERLKALDAHLLLMIHDEVICEVPKANLQVAVPIIQELMQNVASNLPVPFKSDAEVSDVWYGKEINYDEEDDIA